MAFVAVASTSELQPGQRVVVEVGEWWIAIFNVGGTYYAIEDRCTHDDGPLAEGDLVDHTIECPRHGARFNLETGKPTLPATQPVARFPVQAVGDEVQVDVTRRLN